MSKSQLIRDRLNAGYGVTSGIAQDLAGSSGDRTLRRIIAAEPNKYRYFEHKGSEAIYRVYFKAIGSKLRFVKLQHGYNLSIVTDFMKSKRSKIVKTQKELKKLIKKAR